MINFVVFNLVTLVSEARISPVVWRGRVSLLLKILLKDPRPHVGTVSHSPQFAEV